MTTPTNLATRNRELSAAITEWRDQADKHHRQLAILFNALDRIATDDTVRFPRNVAAAALEAARDAAKANAPS